MKTLFLSGPYNGCNDSEIKKNIMFALRVAEKLSKEYNVFCPHSNFVYLADIDNSPEGRNKILSMCFQWIDICDIFCLLPGWEGSVGCKAEYAYAESIEKEIKYLTYGQINV